MTIYGFHFFCDVSSGGGGGGMPLYGIRAGHTHIWDRLSALGFWGA